MLSFQVATYNIHKGFSALNRRFVLPELRGQLRQLSADIIFLQEVQGAHARHSRRHVGYPDLPQHEFLAGADWPHHAYGKNAVYAAGHHGNAILSRYPILSWDNEDISAHRFEQRGLLDCVLEMDQNSRPLHCFCVHLGLFQKGRLQQLERLAERIRALPQETPLVLAGDFNDWRNQAERKLMQPLGLTEVFQATHGRPARSYPAHFPLLALDRIYVRNLTIESASVHRESHWKHLSDHHPLSTRLVLP